ncbi:MAG: CRTAC1 family protein [Pirellula sp.]
MRRSHRGGGVCQVPALSALVLLVWFVSEACVAQDTFNATFANVLPHEIGIDFRHTDGETGKRYMVETILGSLAIFDFDNDGYLDVYLVNGAPLPGSKLGFQPASRLYRNCGNWRFEDVTQRSGLFDTGYGMGVVVADYDNDGFQDLFLSHFGHNSFFVNRGDGTFVESSESSGLKGPHRVGAGASFTDIDGDGDLDLYTATYVQFDWSEHRVRMINGKEFHTGPNDYKPAADFLYRNDGDRTFTDISVVSGITANIAAGMAVASTDFDGDRDMDIFVANDQSANFLLINDGNGRFEFNELIAGVAYDRNGKANGNMGVELADVDGDLAMDIVTTTYQDEMPVYYRCIGPGIFEDATNNARLDLSLTAHVTWGVGAVDFDLDGDRDLFFACGHFFDNIEFLDDRTQRKVSNYLLANDGKGRFRNVTKIAGDAMQIVESSRGAAFDDLDNDGDVDFVVLNINAPPTIGRADTDMQLDRLSICLVGTHGSRDGIGAKVLAVAASGKKQESYVLAGRGYESSYGLRQYFGGGSDPIVSLLVEWPNGARERFERKGLSMLLVQGTGITTGPSPGPSPGTTK